MALFNTLESVADLIDLSRLTVIIMGELIELSLQLCSIMK